MPGRSPEAGRKGSSALLGGGLQQSEEGSGLLYREALTLFGLGTAEERKGDGDEEGKEEEEVLV